MTNEIIERAARAICAQDWIDAGETPDRAAEIARKWFDEHGNNGNAADDCEGYRRNARAALASIRTPTLAMHNAGNAEMAKDGSHVDVTKIFTAMIDSILSDKAGE